MVTIREGVAYRDYYDGDEWDEIDSEEDYIRIQQYWERYGHFPPQASEKSGEKQKSILESVKGVFKSKSEGKEDVTYRLEEGYEIDLPQHIYDELMHAVRELGKESLEVGGLLKVKRTGAKFEVLDYCLLKQDVSGADFEISDAEMAKWAAVKMDEPDFNLWCGWWHSHHTMGLFWSGTDDEMFAKLRGKRVGAECFGIVFTSDGKYRTRFDVNTPLGPVMYDQLRSGKKESEVVADTKKVETLIENNVEKPKPYVYTYGGYALTSSGWKDEDWANAHCEKFAIKKRLWESMYGPYQIDDLLGQASLRKRYLKDWDLKKECIIWNLDYNRVKAYLDKVAKRQEKEKSKDGKSSDSKGTGGTGDAVDALYD